MVTPCALTLSNITKETGHAPRLQGPNQTRNAAAASRLDPAARRCPGAEYFRRSGGAGAWRFPSIAARHSCREAAGLGRDGRPARQVVRQRWTSVDCPAARLRSLASRAKARRPNFRYPDPRRGLEIGSLGQKQVPRALQNALGHAVVLGSLNTALRQGYRFMVFQPGGATASAA